MSYDLFMKPKSGKISSMQFEAYFQDRKNYTIENSQAWYQNEETAVYFVFEYQNDDQDDQEETPYPIAFNMNYFRPSFFVKEAEPEVKAFIEKFNLEVDDPQMNGMSSGEFDSEKFISGWLAGNEFGYQCVLKEQPEISSLPTEKLESVWSWNIKKEELQDELLEDEVFVPSIILLEYQGKTVTACIWPDAIPAVIPPVDVLLIGRNELAPRKLFRKVADMAIADWSNIEPLLGKYKQKMHEQAYYLKYPTVPAEIKKHLSNLKSFDINSLERLSPDQVLNSELVQKHQQ